MDNIYIRFGNKVYRQIVGIPMGTNCVPVVAYLFLFCYERDFMTSLPNDNQTDIIEALNQRLDIQAISLNIDNPYFKEMVNQIYPPELHLSKANVSDYEVPFFIYIYLFLTVLFHPNFKINAMTLILIL